MTALIRTTTAISWSGKSGEVSERNRRCHNGVENVHPRIANRSKIFAEIARDTKIAFVRTKSSAVHITVLGSKNAPIECVNDDSVIYVVETKLSVAFHDVTIVVAGVVSRCSKRF